jgi:hypothetical protein
MIGGLVEHDGHRALALHLAKHEDNETITVGAQGLSTLDIGDALDELNLMALGCRTRKPLLHVWASPSRSYSDHDWQTYWDLFETEYDLEGHPYVEVRHLKLGNGGRSAGHSHRVYLRLNCQGRAVRTSHSGVRQEKISRIAEYLAGERFTSGCFNVSVIERLRSEGQDVIADAMVHAGLDKVVAKSAPTSAERAMTERLDDLAIDEVWRRAAGAWRRSDNGAAFIAALAESGLRLAMGNKCPVLISPAGAVHPLLRALNKGGERQAGTPVRKRDLDHRLRGIALPPANSTEPVTEFIAGPFSIINLDRLPVPHAAKPQTANHQDDNTLPHPMQSRPLTSEQEAALLALDEALHGTAAEKARVARAEIEAEVEKEVSHRRLRDRIRAEKASWELPSIGAAGWRDGYRAELAGLPKQYGPYEKLDADRRRVILKSGATVTLEPQRGFTDRTGSDAVAVLIEHARARNWPGITITGNERWRRHVAIAATRAGLVVSDADLLPIVEAERDRLLLEDWWRWGQKLQSASPSERKAARTKLIALLDHISRRPGILELAPGHQRAMLQADIAAHERYRRALQGQLPRAGPPTTL